MVLAKTNANAHKQRDANVRGHVGGRPFVADFKLSELMKFVGILIMMSVVRAGEYRLYWKNTTTAACILPGTTILPYIVICVRFYHVSTTILPHFYCASTVVVLLLS
jgi:hypothetical protein